MNLLNVIYDYQGALTIVLDAFKDKVDKSGKPYIQHLIRVSNKCDDDLKTIALLHDILEDCPEWTEDRLREIFDGEIVDAVVALTRKEGQSYNDFIKQVCENKKATLVKKADLEDNMDLTRLEKLTDADINRTKKYHSAYRKIINNIKLYGEK